MGGLIIGAAVIALWLFTQRPASPLVGGSTGTVNAGAPPIPPPVATSSPTIPAPAPRPVTPPPIVTKLPVGTPAPRQTINEPVSVVKLPVYKAPILGTVISQTIPKTVATAKGVPVSYVGAILNAESNIKPTVTSTNLRRALIEAP